MELKSLIPKGENIRIIGEISKLYKYDGTTVTEETIPAYDNVGYVLNYNEDIYLFIEQGCYFDVLRVGEPPKVMILKDTQIRTFSQYDENGTLIGTIDSEDIGFGYYTVTPLVLDKGYFELDCAKQPFDFSYTTPGNAAGSVIPVVKLQSNVWQLVAVPLKDAKVYEDVLLKLQNQTGVAIEELVTLCTTYYGDENKYRAFAVGVTNPLSTNNFPLVYDDAGTEEVTAFWIRTKDFAAVGLPDTVLLEW